MKKKYRSLIKNIGLFTIGSFGSKIVIFLMLPLYTSVISTSDFGTIDILQSTAQLLIPILLLSVQEATLRFSLDPEYEKEDVISTTINVILKGSLIFLLGIICINCLHIINLSMVYWIFLFLTFLLNSLNVSFNFYLKSKNNASVIAISGILGTFITCVSNLFFLLILKKGIIGYMISNIIGILSQVIYQFIFGRIFNDVHIKKYNNVSKQMIKYSTPLIANSVAWWVNNASDRYIITLMSGIAVNGIYAVACKIPTVLTTFQSVFYNAWSISAISEFDENDGDGFIGNNYTLYNFVSTAVCSFMMLLNIPIAYILYAGDYFEAWKCIPFLLVGAVFNGLAQFEGSLFAATKKTREVSSTTIIGAIVNTICNFIFIKMFGAIGAAFSTMIGYIVTWFIRTKYMNNFIKIKVNWKQQVVTSLLIIAQAILASLNTLYIIQIMIFIIVVIVHRNYISQSFVLLKKMKDKALNRENESV